MNEITYTRQGDYLLPDLTMPEQPELSMGRYARMRKKFLKEHHKVCWKRIFLAHALKSACPAVRRLSRRATERNIARSALKELTKLSRQSTQEENGQSRKIGAEKASNIKTFQLPHFEG